MCRKIRVYGAKYVLSKKYLQHKSIIDSSYNRHVGCSSTWSSILHGAKLLRSGLGWRIGNGKSINFWNDNWTGLGNLLQFALETTIIDTKTCVHDFWLNNDWNFLLLSSCLPPHIVDHIAAIPICFGDIEDKEIWQLTSNGIFSVRSAYQLAVSCENDPHVAWKRLWSLHVPPKLKVFAWTVVHGRLLTNVQRFTRQFIRRSLLQFLPNQPESMLHLLRNCTFARGVWTVIKIPASLSNFFQMDWTEWISTNVMKRGCKWHSFN